MTGTIPLARMPVGVVIERRKATSAWIDFVWRPVAVLPGVPDAERGTRLGGDDERQTFYAGSAEIELFAGGSARYHENLISGAPGLWVVMRPAEGEPPYQVFAVTADPSEGEAYTEPATDLIESVPMPDDIRMQIAAFVSEHYVEEKFVKRKRSNANPDALARRGPLSREEKR